MFVKRLLSILLVFIFTFFSTTVSRAEEAAALIQAYAWEQNVDVFFTGDMGLDSLSCKVSNQAAEVVDSGLLADRKAVIRTTILVDASMSMPPEARGTVSLYLNTLIQDINDNEQYRIVAFNENMDILQDFTADCNDLAASVNKIEFNGQESRIYDAIYNTMPEMHSFVDMPCYFRTIIITDGIDDTESGITKEELYLKLQTETYPIDVVELSKSEKAEPDKELAALIRISNGKYVNLYPEADLSALSAAISTDSISWLRMTVPEELLDGSTRQIDITDGTLSLHFDIKIPVFDVPVTESPVPKESSAIQESSTEKVSEEEISEETSVIAEPPVKEDISRRFVIPAIICSGIGIVALILVLISLNCRKKRKKKNPSHDKTTKSKEETLLLANSGKSDLRIRLHNSDGSGQEWDMPLSEGVLIGRDEYSHVRLTDKSVSHSQCRIYLTDGVPMIENLSHTNITKVNGKALTESQEIKEGDEIECGYSGVVVGMVYSSKSDSERLNKDTKYVNI